MSVEAQVICTYLVPDGWDDETMETWFTNFLARGDGDGLKDLLFLYETNVLFLTYEDTASGHRIMQVGRPSHPEHDDALD